jgi:hypothetical protein
VVVLSTVFEPFCAETTMGLLVVLDWMAAEPAKKVYWKVVVRGFERSSLGYWVCEAM